MSEGAAGAGDSGSSSLEGDYEGLLLGLIFSLTASRFLRASPSSSSAQPRYSVAICLLLPKPGPFPWCQ